MTHIQKEFDSLKKWQVPIYFIGLLIAGVMTWDNVVAQTETNAKELEELSIEQKALEEKFDKIQDNVLIVQENQKNMKEDMQEIKTDLKILIRSIGTRP